MSANLAPTRPQLPTRTTEAVRSMSPTRRRTILVGMAVCAGLALGGLGISAFTPAPAVFPDDGQ
jgi:hypothetical protein